MTGWWFECTGPLWERASEQRCEWSEIPGRRTPGRSHIMCKGPGAAMSWRPGKLRKVWAWNCKAGEGHHPTGNGKTQQGLERGWARRAVGFSRILLPAVVRRPPGGSPLASKTSGFWLIISHNCVLYLVIVIKLTPLFLQISTFIMFLC